MSLTYKLKMVFSVLCFFFKPASWHLLLYQYRSIHFDTHISKQHSPIKSPPSFAPFILWAPAPPKISARPCSALRVRCETRLHWSARSVKSFSCYNVLRLAARALWSSADHELAQVLPCQIFTGTLSKNGRSLEPFRYKLHFTTYSHRKQIF